jgi:hypothetical protein
MLEKIICRVEGASYIRSEAYALLALCSIHIRIRPKMYQINSVISILLPTYQQESNLCE